MRITILSHDFQSVYCTHLPDTEGKATKNMMVPDTGRTHQLWTTERECSCF